jgi:hypothetical protein
MRRSEPSGGTTTTTTTIESLCTSAFYGVGYTVEEVCCSPLIEQLFYNQVAIAPGDAGNPLYLYGCGDTLFTGYIDSGPYPVTNGIINYIPIACPECPASCYCYNLVLEAFSTDYEYTDCCGERFSGNTSQGFTICCDANNPPFASSGTWYQLGPCNCGDVCGR